MRLTALAALVFGLITANQQLASAQQSIDEARQTSIAQFREAGIPNPDRIREAAAAEFSKPTADQSETTLRMIARDANAYANFVGLIESGYTRERSANLRYDFVVQPIDQANGNYVKVSNEFKAIRNRAYFILAQRAESSGDMLQALYLYNDAFRLTSFTCGTRNPDPGECLRLDAEQAMQRILNIRDAQPYTTWQNPAPARAPSAPSTQNRR